MIVNNNKIKNVNFIKKKKEQTIWLKKLRESFNCSKDIYLSRNNEFQTWCRMINVKCTMF